MRKNTTLAWSILVLCAILFGCQPAPVAEHMHQVSLRDPGGIPNYHSSGDRHDYLNQAVFSSILVGDIATSTDFDVHLVEDSPRRTIFCGGHCAPIIFSGLDLLNPCFSHFNTAVYYELREFNKKKHPGRIASHFWFIDEDISSTHYIKFSMFGSILGEDDFVPAAGPVSIVFDRWWIRTGRKILTGANDTNDACLQEEAVDLDPSIAPVLTFYLHGIGCP